MVLSLYLYKFSLYYNMAGLCPRLRSVGLLDVDAARTVGASPGRGVSIKVKGYRVPYMRSLTSPRPGKI
jgi:hypothetical protein